MDIAIPLFDELHRARRHRPLRGALAPARRAGALRRRRARRRTHRQRHARARRRGRRSTTCPRPDVLVVPGGFGDARAGRRARARLGARAPTRPRRGRRRSAPARCSSAPPGSSTGSRRPRTGCDCDGARDATARDPTPERVVEQGKVITAAGVSARASTWRSRWPRGSRATTWPRRSSSASSTTRSRRSTPARSRMARPGDRGDGPRGRGGAHRELARADGLRPFAATLRRAGEPAGSGGMVVGPPMTDVRETLRSTFGFEAFRPGQEDAVARRARRAATCSSSCPPARASRCATSCPALVRDDLTLVVSPLVVADAGPGRGAGARRARRGRRSSTPSRTPAQPRGDGRAPRRASCELLYVAPERFSSPGFAQALKAARDRAVRRRRGALRLAVGPRLPPRLLPPGRRRALAGGVGDRRLHGDRDAAGRDRHRPAPGAARPGPASRRASTGPNLSFAVVPCRTAADKRQRAGRGPAASRARCRRSSTRARATDADELAGALARGARAARRGLPRGPGARAARGGAAALHGRRARRGRGDERVRHGRRQGRRAHGRARERAAARSRPTTRRPAAPGATARPARALLFAESRDKGLHVFFIQRAEVDEQAIGRVAAMLDGLGVATAATTSRVASCRRRSPTPCGDRRPSRPRRRDPPGARAARPRCAGGVLGPYDGAAAATCRTPAGEASARAGASTARSGPSSRATRAAARAILRHFGDPAAAARRRLPCCDVCDPGARCPAAPPRGGARRPRRCAAGRPRRGDRRGRRDRRARGRAHADGGDPARRALEGGAQARLRRAAGLRHVRPPRRGPGPRPRRRADRRGRLRLDGRRLPEAARAGERAAAEGRRPRLGRGHEPPGAARHGPRPRGARSSPSPPTSPTPVRWSAREARGRADGASSRAPTTPTARRATRRSPTGSTERGVELVVLAGYMALLDAGVPRALPRRGRQRPPVAAAGLPGLGAIQQALDYGVKVFGVTVHLVDDGVDTGPGRPAGARRAARRARRRRGPRARCARSSTRCCPRRWRCSRAGRGAARPGAPAPDPHGLSYSSSSSSSRVRVVELGGRGGASSSSSSSSSSPLAAAASTDSA